MQPRSLHTHITHVCRLCIYLPPNFGTLQYLTSSVFGSLLYFDNGASLPLNKHTIDLNSSITTAVHLKDTDSLTA